MREIPVPENDWIALNLWKDRLEQYITGLETKVTKRLDTIEKPSETAVIIEATEGASDIQEPEQPWDGPGNVAFDTVNSSFNDEYPTLVWYPLVDKGMEYEIRTDLNFGNKTNLVEVVRTDSRYGWKKWTPSDGRTCTAYIKARDSEGRYSKTYGSITLTNTAPTMAAITPTITKLKHGKILRLLWATYTQPNDLARQAFKIFVSTVSPVSIADDTYFVDWVSRGNDHYDFAGERGVTYYFRIEPYDVFGAGVAS